MTSKREEERNEKIIRGLMKLPPNRRCINCNGLGPQYVCTNFWTFICMACSGIHREFTHRVKSVSMSKFSSQEVEALEKGGNQRARETYLRDWDPQIQRLPDSSNAERVREFIKSVYVDRRYATGKPSDKPPRDAQNFRNREDETRRASSYHSYSQSPPYDNQYEDRLYGRHVHTLRRPGSDRSLYEGKVSCFSSPSRLSDQQSEDRFANEEPNHRVSDYSLSVSGDPFKTHPLSPNFERNIGSPSSQTSGDTFSEDSRHHRVSSFTETNPKMDPNGLLRPQRTASLGSFGSFDSKSMPFKSVSSIDLFNDASIHEQPAGIHKSSDGHDVTSLTEPSTNRNLNGLDLFHSTVVTQNISSNTMVDLFQLPGAPKAPHADLFQLPGVPKAPHADLFQLPDAPKAPHADLFQPPSSSVREVGVNQTSKSKSSSDTFSGKVASFPDRISLDDESVVKNEGWATFDIPHHLSDPGIKDAAQGVSTSVAGNHVGKMDQHLPPNTNLQWPAFGDASIHWSSLVSNLWPEDLNSFLPTEPWSAAFTPSTEHFPPGTILPGGNHDDVPPDVRHYMGDFSVNEILRGPSNGAYVHSSLPIDADGPQSHGIDRRSTNPFDLPYDTDLESSDMFLDMNSLQSALPSEPILSNAYIDVMGGQPWFSQNSVVPQDPSQGSLVFIGGEVSSTQLQNISAQGPVASVGGNPFA